jgi:formylglycine-generating enzyme required for sulfatase activity
VGVRPFLVVSVVGAAALFACGLDAVGSAIGLPDREDREDVELPDTSAPVEEDAEAGDLDAGFDASACPSGRGPAMLRVERPASAYCIDRTEVAEAHYASFLTADASLATLPAECAFKAAYGSPVPRGPQRPAGGVDWCDAWAFCRWAGKRLCSAEEWRNACSNGDASVFPYGNTFDAATCNGGVLGAPTDVGSMPGCKGGIPDLWDMSGNIDEWSATCIGEAGAGDTCTTHGGDYSGDPEAELRCASQIARARSAVIAFVGFRCCN